MLRAIPLLLAALLAPTVLAITDGTGGPDAIERQFAVGCYGPTVTEEVYCNTRNMAFVLVYRAAPIALEIGDILVTAVVADAAAAEVLAGDVQGPLAEGDAVGAATMTLGWADERCGHWIRSAWCHGRLLG